MQKFIITIDPGKDKCGLAVVSQAGGVSYKCVLPTTQIVGKLEELKKNYDISQIILGNKTGAKALRQKLQRTSIQIILVDEHKSSEIAKIYYFKDNPPKGLRKLIPISWQTPPEPFDDYVAIVLAERYFAAKSEKP